MSIQKSSQENNLIKCIEKIGSLATGFNGDPERINLQDPNILTLSEFLDVPPLQTVIFSVIFILNFKNRNVDTTDMAKYLDTQTINVLPWLTEMEPLENRRLIRRYSANSRTSELRRASIFEIGYFITRNVLEGLLRCDKSYLNRKEQHTMVSLLEEVGIMVSESDDGAMTFEDLANETLKLVQCNTELPFVRGILRYGLKAHDLVILLYVCHQTLEGTDGIDLNRMCEKIFDNADTRFQMRRNIFKGRNELMQKGLLKLREGFFKSDREVLLTEKALDDLFGEDKDFIQSAQNRSNRELISCESIGESRLFFNNEEQKKLDFVTSLLHETRYRTTVRRLEKMNMRPGISILFHGVPGTGKTASAHEIARRTGRDLFVVDISRTKSMWFGESEKIIKELFENYARLVKNSRKAPVLLFNEADAVFSTRKAVSHSSVAQTENTIQNIILQEMENLNGIMIATTNLTQNLDRAFERRFLFKIAFRRPDEATRLRILRDKLPNLAMEEVMLIARQFDLSGGNIDNISRKTEMHKVLKGKYPDLPALIEFCHEETMDMAGGRKIGFC